MAGRKMTDEEKRLHQEHRERVKKKVREIGLANLPEHEVLEYLLFFSIPWKDVNPLAHVLINKFGSLAGVLDASYEELLKVNGIGEHSAIFLSSLPGVFDRYKLIKWDDLPYFAASDIYGPYAVDLLAEQDKEEFCIICLNSAGRLIRAEKLGEGTVNSVHIPTRNVAEIALRNNAVSVIFAHNHPADTMYPSRADIELTQALSAALMTLNISTLDHVIVGRGEYFSFRDNSIPLY
ncbi:MAG: RadC family protein [Firmicutes bacterium]|nr:RadC family protein [Bacillota bacterium]